MFNNNWDVFVVFVEPWAKTFINCFQCSPQNSSKKIDLLIFIGSYKFTQGWYCQMASDWFDEIDPGIYCSSFFM